MRRLAHCGESGKVAAFLRMEARPASCRKRPLNLMDHAENAHQDDINPDGVVEKLGHDQDQDTGNYS